MPWILIVLRRIGERKRRGLHILQSDETPFRLRYSFLRDDEDVFRVEPLTACLGRLNHQRREVGALSNLPRDVQRDYAQISGHVLLHPASPSPGTRSLYSCEANAGPWHFVANIDADEERSDRLNDSGVCKRTCVDIAATLDRLYQDAHPRFALSIVTTHQHVAFYRVLDLL